MLTRLGDAFSPRSRDPRLRPPVVKRNQIMRRTWRFAVPIMLSLTVLAGCGNTPEEKSDEAVAASPQASPGADKRREIEAVKADCMKKKGFKYVAFVPKPKPDAVVKAGLGDHAAMKEYRSKYGFDAFSQSVYGETHPQNPGLENNPNDELLSNLSGTQVEAYHTARDECHIQGVNAVLGKTFSSVEELYAEVDQVNQRIRDALNADPQLVSSAQRYADCLKGKGYQVADVKPIGILWAVPQVFQDQFQGLAKAKQDAGGKGRTELIVTPQEARPYLAREIKAALEDLECGKEFHAAFGPKRDRLKAEQNLTNLAPWG
ncbi:hypothetical protein [Rhizohabitans arisaemae]|uniref:hypothetical protein n=1 Tax=Rhizohabitans arisaemae TaxID=2720610 RepID=UPI0024B203B2|nr:hypothetical protein [Rhizohabitans arisaemae]